MEAESIGPSVSPAVTAGAKNTLGRLVPVKTMTDVEDDKTSEDGSLRPVCISVYSA